MSELRLFLFVADDSGASWSAELAGGLLTLQGEEAPGRGAWGLGRPLSGAELRELRALLEELGSLGEGEGAEDWSFSASWPGGELEAGGWGLPPELRRLRRLLEAWGEEPG